MRGSEREERSGTIPWLSYRLCGRFRWATLVRMAEPNPPPGGATSLSLLERARGRDAEAWRRLVQLYSPLIFFWAGRAGLRDADAADLVQDVWHAVSRGLDQF